MATQIDDKKVQSGAANDPSVLTEDQSVSEPGKQNKVINYQSTGWKSTSVLLAKTQIGLGVLALPSALDKLGGFVGILAIVVIGLVVTYANYVVGTFARRHGNVYSPADAGYILFGPIGREIFGSIFWLLQVCIAGSGFLATSIALNTFADGTVCTVVFVVVAMVIGALFAALPEFRQIAWLGWVGLLSIVAAIVVLMGVVGAEGRPPLAPPGDFDRQLTAFGTPSPADAFVALVDILFAYAGTPAYFSMLNEMKDSRDYTKAMLLAQAGCITFYVVVSVVIWRYCGVYIASPALGSAGQYFQVVCYGIAFPGLEVGAIIYLHLSAKYIFVRAFRGTRHLTEQTVLHWVGWLGCVIFCAAFGFVIAEAIPFFSSLLGLLGALFASMLCMVLPAMLWYKDHLGMTRSKRWWAMACANAAILLLGLFLLGAGTWGSAESIKDQYSADNVGTPFSCADNSGTGGH